MKFYPKKDYRIRTARERSEHMGRGDASWTWPDFDPISQVWPSDRKNWRKSAANMERSGKTSAIPAAYAKTVGRQAKHDRKVRRKTGKWCRVPERKVFRDQDPFPICHWAKRAAKERTRSKIAACYKVWNPVSRWLAKFRSGFWCHQLQRPGVHRNAHAQQNFAKVRLRPIRWLKMLGQNFWIRKNYFVNCQNCIITAWLFLFLMPTILTAYWFKMLKLACRRSFRCISGLNLPSRTETQFQKFGEEFSTKLGFTLVQVRFSKFSH